MGGEAGAAVGTHTNGFENSTMSSSSHKRGSNTATSGESPSKKTKTPLLKTVVKVSCKSLMRTARL